VRYLSQSISGSLRSREGETMAQAKSGDTVKVHYAGKVEDGTVFESTRG